MASVVSFEAAIGGSLSEGGGGLSEDDEEQATPPMSRAGKRMDIRRFSVRIAISCFDFAALEHPAMAVP
jgi:hypothetical protein